MYKVGTETAASQRVIWSRTKKGKKLKTKPKATNTVPKIYTGQRRAPSVHLRNTPAFSKANTTDAATTPAANQRIERRAHKIERTLSTPAWRIINQAAPSSK